jgi:hypothetical protein
MNTPSLLGFSSIKEQKARTAIPGMNTPSFLNLAAEKNKTTLDNSL